MRYELFGTTGRGQVEFLGTFIDHDQLLKAVDEYTALGYKRVRYAEWHY